MARREPIQLDYRTPEKPLERLPLEGKLVEPSRPRSRLRSIIMIGLALVVIALIASQAIHFR